MTQTPRPESTYFDKVFMDVPFPIRDEVTGDMIGYEWKQTDMIKLLDSCPNGYSPFTEAEGFHFSNSEADVIMHFIINECVFPEGPLTGKPFIPERWQWAVFLNMYCWFEDTNPSIRRYNEVLVYIPRKNGKTTAFGAIPSLISLYVDPEKRSQNFCCAADTEQAALNFRHAAYMVEQNPKMLNKLQSGRVRHGTKFMQHNNGRTLKVLSSVADTKHGLSPNYVGVDEVHAHPNSELIDVMVTGTAARSNPLILYTTTADYDRPSTCNELHKRARSVCQGLQSDPSFLPILYEALPDDDWDSEAVWKKANPNYGISINERYFKKEIQRVKNSPQLLNRFLRLHLNVKTAVETSWIYPHVWGSTNPKYNRNDVLKPGEIRHLMERHSNWFDVVGTEAWKSSQVDIHLKQFSQYYTWFWKKVSDLRESPCFAAYDNAAVKDIASLSLWFPETHDLLSFNWVPAESIERRTVEDQIPYQIWFNSGVINNTPQTTIDEDSIVESMVGDETSILHYFEDLRMVAFDNWGSNYISNQLMSNGLNCRSYPQSFAGMNHPCKVMESLMEQKNLFHGGHPVLTWMIGNTMIQENNNDQIRPDRKNSTDKIDGIVSSLMALGAWLYDEEKTIDSIHGISEDD